MPSLLIIEDSSSIRKMVKSKLEETGLMDEVFEAENGSKGLKLLKKENPDVVLLCLVLPDIDGLTILRTIRALAAYKDLPVIVLTGTEEVSSKIQALDMGASDYLVKPFDYGELIARVNVQLKIKHLQDELKGKNEELHQISVTDFLTSINNRRHFMNLFQVEFERSMRYQQPLCFLILDVDHFKLINDTYGHAIGDCVLVEIAKLLKLSLRTPDLVGRYGGEEFVALLTMATTKQAETVAERIRAMIECHQFDEMEGELVTISIGMCSYPEEHIQSMDELIISADKALYAAKEAGRNRVACSTPQGIKIISD